MSDNQTKEPYHPHPNRYILYLLVPVVVFSLIVIIFIWKDSSARQTEQTSTESNTLLQVSATPTTFDSTNSETADEDLELLDNDFAEIEKAFDEIEEITL